MQIVKSRGASSTLPEGASRSEDKCMVITGAAVHPGVQLIDISVHASLLVYLSMLIISSNASSVCLQEQVVELCWMRQGSWWGW